MKETKTMKKTKTMTIEKTPSKNNPTDFLTFDTLITFLRVDNNNLKIDSDP